MVNLLELEFLPELPRTAFFPGKAFSSRKDVCLRVAAATGVFGNIAAFFRVVCSVGVERDVVVICCGVLQ